MSLPGVAVSEILPWKEGETYWAGLRVTFPAHLASHRSTQEFYFGDDYLLRRHDYTIDVARNANFHAAQYVYDMIEVSGKAELMIAIDLVDIHFS